MRPLAVVPSPKSHTTVTASSSGSLAEPAKVMVLPAATATSPAGSVIVPWGGLFIVVGVPSSSLARTKMASPDLLSTTDA